MPSQRSKGRNLVWCLGAALALLSSACSPLGDPINPEASPNYYYSKGGDGVIYCAQGNWLKLGTHAVEGADAATIEALASDLAVDKDRVYYRWHPQAQVDRKSLTVKAKVWSDRSRVYFPQSGETLGRVDGADPSSFRYLFPDDVNPRMWARDAKRYFINHKPVDVDAPSFRFLNQGFVADKDQIYHRNPALRPVTRVDGPIEVLNDNHLRMGTKILSGGTWSPAVIELPTIERVREISPAVLVVDQNVYSRGKLVPSDQVDAATLKAWPDQHSYARDRQRVYATFGDLKAVEGADLKTFSPMKDYSAYAKDAQHVYYQGRIVSDADLESFEIVFRDKKPVARDRHGEFVMGLRR